MYVINWNQWKDPYLTLDGPTGFRKLLYSVQPKSLAKIDTDYSCKHNFLEMMNKNGPPVGKSLNIPTEIIGWTQDVPTTRTCNFW